MQSKKAKNFRICNILRNFKLWKNEKFMKSLGLKFTFQKLTIKQTGFKSSICNPKANSSKNLEMICIKFSKQGKKEKSKPVQNLKKWENKPSLENNKEVIDLRYSKPTSTKPKRTENKN